jgi:hypothetical protein
MDDIKSNIKVLLDDCLLHTKIGGDLLATHNLLSKQCQKYGLKLHDSKCVFFATMVRYCGRLITKYGVHFDPNNKRCRLCAIHSTVPTWYSMSRQ